MKTLIVKILLAGYKKSYKRPGLIRKIVRALIPLRIKANFIMLDKGKNLWGFGNISEHELGQTNFVHFVSLKNEHEVGRKLGSARDVSFKTEILSKIHGKKYRKFICPAGDNLIAISLSFLKLHNQFLQLPPKTIIYIDIPGVFPKTVKVLKKKFPNLRVIVRAHNPEPLHNFDKFLATWKPKWLKKSIQTYYADKKMLKHADGLDTISRSDFNLYWSKISQKEHLKKIRVLPYSLCQKDLKSMVKFGFAQHQTYESAVIMGSVGKNNPLNQKSVSLFIKNISKIKTQLGIINIAATGTFTAAEELKLQKAGIKLLGNVDNISYVLEQSDLLIDIGGYGHGFKTKYLDAINNGCKIVISHKYVKRIPLSLLPFFITIDNEYSPHEYSSISSDALSKYASIALDRIYLTTENMLSNMELQK